MTTKTAISIPRAFISKRIHSLMGLWIVIYLIEHLVTNAQAALWIGNDGKEFIKLVNAIHAIPFLKVVEVLLLGVPIGFHAIWGIKYALTSKNNAKKSDGSKPSLPEYGRNRAYNWQRISSWILLLGIIFHVIQMRFIDYPVESKLGNQNYYLVSLTMDEGLYTLADRLGVVLINNEKINQLKNGKLEQSHPIFQTAKPIIYDKKIAEEKHKEQLLEQSLEWNKALLSFSLSKTGVIARADNPGTAFLLSVRNTFKSPLMMIIYTIFVLAAGFHGFNGLWTFLNTWGVILSYRSQKTMVNVCLGCMIIMIFLGLASIFGTYWINLRY